MTDTEIIIEVAKLDGLEDIKLAGPFKTVGGTRPILLDGTRVGYGYENAKDYLTSRDAIVPVIEGLRLAPTQAKVFLAEILNETNNELSLAIGFWDRRNPYDLLRLLLATPRQLCIALLKATGKWKE